ncbi:zinc-ribbon domain-containing protein [Cupriavidus sp. TMH.W2]|uniref:zinc-ribbon domain-containing protein n=1 Tax=Cupriavidus sp. TMH.W2 TaxID=3434465 RepID=UPI003D77FCC1
MRELARSRGGECLSAEYGNWDSTLRWRCAQGHEWENRAGKVKQGQWCPTCAGKAPKGLAFLHELAAQKGGTCLSTTYPGMQGLAMWRCPSGHVWQARPSNVRYGTWCPHCLGRHQTIKDMRALAQARGGTCLSEAYVSAVSKLVWQCSDKHVWQATPNSLRNGSWCPHCRINYGEEICRLYFEALFGRPFPKSRPRFLWTGPRGVMELDGYCEELKLAFEHHGEQHYRMVPMFHRSEEDFAQQLRRDEEKLKRCRCAGVTVIEIPAVPVLTSVEGLPRLIRAKLADVGITPICDADLMALDLTKIYDRAGLTELQQIARSKGGQLLSEAYLGDRGRLRWRCAEGHEWLSTPNNIRAGKWCAFCYGNVRRTLDEIRAGAKQHGFTLLSDEYRGTHGKLRWRCPQGHEWEASSRRVANGETGCPHCAGQLLTIEDMKRRAQERGGQCLSPKYLGSTVALRWQCAKGHEFEMTPNRQSQLTGEWCSTCRDEARRTVRSEHRMARLLEVIGQRGGTVTAGEYRSPHSRLSFRCAAGHEWTTTYDSVFRGSWCAVCHRASRLTPASIASVPTGEEDAPL